VHALSVTRLVPTDALLEICPLQSVSGIFGCISRREVAERRIEFQSKSIVNIAPNSPAELQSVSANAGKWLQGLLGTSDYVRDLGYNHSMIMNKKYSLNARYRSGFMISPTVPWRESDIARLELQSILELAQFSISAVMLSLDINIGSSYVSAMPNLAPAAMRRLLQAESMDSGVVPVSAGSVSRMLLTVSSERPSDDKNQSAVETSMREITSTNNRENVALAVCDRSFPTCELLTVKKTVSVEDFCLSEGDFVAKKQAEISADFRGSSQDTIGFVKITSVLKKGFETICKKNARRLLQTQTVFVTMAVQTNGPYVIAVDTLRLSGYGDVTMLTRNVSMMRFCDTTVPGSCTILPVGVPVDLVLVPINVTVPLYGATTVETKDVAVPAIIAIVIGGVLFVFCVGFILYRNRQSHSHAFVPLAYGIPLEERDNNIRKQYELQRAPGDLPMGQPVHTGGGTMWT